MGTLAAVPKLPDDIQLAAAQSRGSAFSRRENRSLVESCKGEQRAMRTICDQRLRTGWRQRAILPAETLRITTRPYAIFTKH
jgi:hypothetical protein